MTVLTQARLAVSGVAAGLLALSGCGAADHGEEDSAGPTYVDDGLFVMAINFDPGSYNPYHSQLVLGISALAYDSLLNIDEDGGFVSGLAEDWSSDSRTATFALKEGVTCSDGHELKASDVASALEYLGDPAHQSPLYGLTVPTIPYSVEANDRQHTIVVTMDQPSGFLLESLGLTPIVCPAGLDDPSVMDARSFGTGPFVLDEVVHGQEYRFQRRRDYVWGPDGASTATEGMPEEVVLRVITNESTAANLLLADEINFAMINSSDQQRLDSAGLARVEFPAPGAWLWFNHAADRPTADDRVRRALIAGLDLDELVKVSTAGKGSPAQGLVAMEPNPCPGDAIGDRLPEYDTKQAAELLTEAGWEPGADGTRTNGNRRLEIDLHYVPALFAGYEPTAELIADYWAELGISVELVADTTAQLNKVMFETSDFDVYLNGFGVNLPSQMLSYVSGPTAPDGANLSGIDNDRYNERAARAQTVSRDEACALWHEAEGALYDRVDVVPISVTSRPHYLANAEAAIRGFTVPVPTSLRVTE